jgi:predicted acyltransferase
LRSSLILNPSSLPPDQPVKRLFSIDALRGFDMFWIVGGDEFIAKLNATFPNGVTNLLAAQMTHTVWAGLTFYDLIFPLFVFVVGVVLVFSLSRIIQERGKAVAVRRVFVRAVLLYLLGILYYGGFSGTIGNIRLLGVLQRIALCYLFAGLIFIFFRWRGMVVALVVLLVGYWVMLTLIPVPGVGAGNYAERMNLANYVDRVYLPLFKWDGDHDPEGILSTLPAIGTCLLGAFAGLLLKNETMTGQKKVFWLCGAGVATLLLGYLWGLQFPIIKKIWTSTYVLVAGGYSSLLLAFFYQLIEVWKWKKWAMPFIWIGSNAIVLYLAYNFINFNDLAQRLVGGPIKHLFGHGGNLLVTTVTVGLSTLLAYFLYRKKFFIRL